MKLLENVMILSDAPITTWPATERTSGPIAEGKRKQRLLGDDAVATWRLQRIRRRPHRPRSATLSIEDVLAAGRASRDGWFEYRHSRINLRPIVAATLVELWAAGGQAIAVESLCEAVYGRPASLRAVRQTTFRCSRAMERANCPLIVCCHASTVFLELCVRTFEARVPVRSFALQSTAR